MSATRPLPERDLVCPAPNDSELLMQWEAVVHGTVVMIVTTYRTVPGDVQSECLADAQLAIAECGARLVSVVERLRGVSP